MRWMVLGVALVGTAHAGHECAIKGQAVEGFAVTAQAKGGPPVKLYIHGVKASARPPDRLSPETVARIEVAGPLAFAGSAPFDHVPYKTARAVDATNGMVHLPPGVEGFTLRARGARWAEGDLKLGGAVLRGLILACDALTLDPVPSPAVELTDTAAWQSAGRVLELHSGPGSGATLNLDVGSDLSALDLSQVETRGPWKRVTARWWNGTTVTGWVKQTELRERKRSGELGDTFASGSACKPRQPAAATGKLVKARVAPGTPLSADRLFPWATAQSSAPLLVRYQPNESWVEVVSVPGIVTDDGNGPCSTVLEDAWVPRAAVVLAGEAPDGGVHPDASTH